MMYNNRVEAPASITIRASSLGDDRALRRLAQRDSRAVPDGELLVAAVDGELRAAISVANGEVIADPFHPTQELVRMLALRRLQLGDRPPRRQMHGWADGARPRLA